MLTRGTRAMMLWVMDPVRSVVCVLALLTALAGTAPTARAAEVLRLGVPERLVETGLLKYVLPRFSLKTGVRIELVADGGDAHMDIAADGDGRAVFTGHGQTWRMRIRDRDHSGAARLADWLISEVGHRTIAAYHVDGAAPFAPAIATAVEEAPLEFDGDKAQGLALSRTHCGRCHVVARDEGDTSIGSTPSFFALKALADWDMRFQIFYVLNPHPAFTQIVDVTDPFPIDRPSPIVPVTITPEEMEDILAYVSGLAPADLGEPLVHQ